MSFAVTSSEDEAVWVSVPAKLATKVFTELARYWVAVAVPVPSAPVVTEATGVVPSPARRTTSTLAPGTGEPFASVRVRVGVVFSPALAAVAVRAGVESGRASFGARVWRYGGSWGG